MTEERDETAKRKKGRRRLNHKQTRYLITEFGKQAYPDKVHMKKLAGDIPGFSARQVQVWFQNRRARQRRENAKNGKQPDTSQALCWQVGCEDLLLTSLHPHGGAGNIRPLPIADLRRLPSDEQQLLGFPLNNVYTAPDEATWQVRASSPRSTQLHCLLGQGHYPEYASLFSHEQSYDQSAPTTGESTPYGMGFPYEASANYRQNERQHYAGVVRGAKHAIEGEPCRGRVPSTSCSYYESPYPMGLRHAKSQKSYQIQAI